MGSLGRWSAALIVLAVALAPRSASAQIYDPSAGIYNSTTGFSSTQGANQWSYLDGDGVPMVYDASYADGAWHSATPAGGDWCYISRTQQHPGNNTAAKDAIRRWTAPYSGTVSIVGTSRMTNAYPGDGAVVIIRRNGGQLFRGLVPSADTTVGQSWSLTSTVVAGDTIDTVVNRGGTYNNDEQLLTQTIAYQSQQFTPDQAWTVGAYYGDRGTVFADVTGDGRADALAVSNNAVTVRRSNGNSFTANETWSWDPAFPPNGIRFADVNGDSRADMIRIDVMAVFVRLSTGTDFGPPVLWTWSPFTPGTVMTTLADVNGDGSADLIAVDTSGIRVRESFPSASRFIAQYLWSGPFVGSRSTHFADVNGDAMADAIAVDNAAIRVELSFGDQFGPAVQWSSTVNAPGQDVFADIDGDSRADAIVLGGWNTPVTVRRARATGFGPAEAWTTSPFYGSRGTFIADVTGDANDPRADAIAVNDYGVIVRRAPAPLGAIDAPATAGAAIRVSTIDLRGPQANTSSVYDPGLAELSSVPAVERDGPANGATIVAYVSSNTTPAAIPQRIRLFGTVRMFCEGFRTPSGLPGAFTETYSSFYEEYTPSTAQASLSVSRTINPNDYSCGSGMLRRLRVEAYAHVFDAGYTMIAVSSPIRFTLFRTLKVMSWNIEGAYHNGTPDSTIWDIGNVIDEEQVDVALLQEVHVNFKRESNFLDEMAILRNRLAPYGLSSDAYQPRCSLRPDSSAGLGIFSRFPLQSHFWDQYGIVVTSCGGGFNKYHELFGTQSIRVAFGESSLEFGNTHYPIKPPQGFLDTPTALIAFGARNAQAMNNSPSAFLMGGDYNMGPTDTFFSGITSLPTVTWVPTAPPPAGTDIDHMFFKSTTAISVLPVEAYFRDWDYRGPLSDHFPKVTLYDVR